MTASIFETLRPLAVALATGGAFALGAWRARLLTPAAALTSGALAASIVGLGGAAWAVPALAFFGSSAALSRLPAPEAEVEGPRDVRQVLANGGVAWALLLAGALDPRAAPLCFWGFAGGFAAAAADTWATEIGGRFGGRPFSLRTLRRVGAGGSGAVSGVGTLAAAAGALAVSASAVPLAPQVGPPALAAMLVAATAGLLGATVDSLAGAFLQARFRHARTGRRTEAPRTAGGRRNRRVRGLPGLTNDGVNLLCTLTGVGAAVAGAAWL